MNEYYYQDQLRELEKKKKELGKRYELMKKKPFEINKTESAFYTTPGYGTLVADCWEPQDIEEWVPCKNSEIVKNRGLREQLNAKLERFAYQNDAYVKKSDWGNGSIKKFFISAEYDLYSDDYQFTVSEFTGKRPLSEVYFSSLQITMRAIERIVIPFQEINKLF